MTHHGGFAINQTAQRLFNELDAAAVYDDGFLLKLIAYREQCPRSEKFDVLYAKYALANGAVDVALESALKAYERRKADAVIWRLLAECYERKGEPLKAALFRGLLLAYRHESLTLNVPPTVLREYIGMASVAMSNPRGCPWLDHMLTDSGETAQGLLLGTFLPKTQIYATPESHLFGRFFSGIHVRDGMPNIRSSFMQRLQELQVFRHDFNIDLVHDLTRGIERNEVTVTPRTAPLLLPLIGVNGHHEIQFETANQTHHWLLAQWAPFIYRLTEPTTITSGTPFIVGRPIPLRHSPHRKRVVINILADALNWGAAKADADAIMPNIVRFFREGIIFDNSYSVSEYTYPSLATIETGLMPTHTQVFNHFAWTQLPPTVRTLSERMSDAGYHCATLLTHGDMVYNDVLRGHDHILVNTSREHAYEGVERAIQHLEAFDECDNFLFLHCSDTHPDADQIVDNLSVQTKQSLDRRFAVTFDRVSMMLDKEPTTEQHLWRKIRLMDNALGRLFDYLEAHYRDDEYVVHFYSDHGAATYTTERWYMNEGYTHATLMVRGGEIPRLGLVPELVSTADIYPIVLRNVGLPPEPGIDGRLPKCLGGEREREYTISYSVFTGQTCKLCLRNRDYEFRLETDTVTQLDNRADFSAFRYGLFTRDAAHREVHDDEIERHFLGLAAKVAQDLSDDGQTWSAERPFRIEVADKTGA